MCILVLNGPNLNLLGVREPGLYGTVDYDGLLALIQQECDRLGVQVRFYQSNHEGDLVDAIQAARLDCDGIVLNPGAYTHTSIAILDALKAAALPAAEVHITDINRREAEKYRDWKPSLPPQKPAAAGEPASATAQGVSGKPER